MSKGKIHSNYVNQYIIHLGLIFYIGFRNNIFTYHLFHNYYKKKYLNFYIN